MSLSQTGTEGGESLGTTDRKPTEQEECQNGIKKGDKNMAWIIKAYIPVEPEDQEVYATREEAEKDIESLSLMQPENLYEIEEVEEEA